MPSQPVFRVTEIATFDDFLNVTIPSFPDWVHPPNLLSNPVEHTEAYYTLLGGCVHVLEVCGTVDKHDPFGRHEVRLTQLSGGRTGLDTLRGWDGAEILVREQFSTFEYAQRQRDELLAHADAAAMESFL